MENLAARLRRIRQTGGRRETQTAESGGGVPPGTGSASNVFPLSAGTMEGWVHLGHQTLKRTLQGSIDFPLSFPPSLPVLVPDLGRCENPRPEDLLFLDLETTGLSGGAGTVAFLAAFARIVPGNPALLLTVQYLLLDYPGESDFLEALLGEFKRDGKKPVVVSYNGKSFDAQILKTRCLMNGLFPPDFYHADLLHPSRRLWKMIPGGCSQGEIERSVLGIDRSDDTPGALAPDIWFHFLKTGETQALEGICDHNFRDVRGLASIFSVLARIAEDPEGAGEYRADPEQLALIWRRTGMRNGAAGVSETAERLLAAAAVRGCPRALFLRSRDLFVRGRDEEGRALLFRLVRGQYEACMRLPALRMLAVDAEWRLGDAGKALSFTEEALALGDMSSGLRAEMEKRKKRLVKKAETGG
ncbi:MAG: ribonuclease H-like domain-containing protein [Treponema sp.]|jgi:uncharacterized protein YprB with RNaseH-like and TPR domain|nr:ribonuclease H-like domain-containing protein [Treponema sp.]